ncbi:hypothetical protein niasHT_012869 [Heterodera trifolii]|uniref:Uncharacterized protein n=1 Tax=Heterodera trifolii TaxID=157864 RepID=A0ABD2KYG5_9BILA
MNPNLRFHSPSLHFPIRELSHCAHTPPQSPSEQQGTTLCTLSQQSGTNWRPGQGPIFSGPTSKEIEPVKRGDRKFAFLG